MMRTLVTSIAGSAGRDRLCEHQSNHAGKLRVFEQHNSIVRKQKEIQIKSLVKSLSAVNYISRFFFGT